MVNFTLRVFILHKRQKCFQPDNFLGLEALIEGTEELGFKKLVYLNLGWLEFMSLLKSPGGRISPSVTISLDRYFSVNIADDLNRLSTIGSSSSSSWICSLTFLSWIGVK